MPNYCANLPLQMWDSKPTQRRARVLTIAYERILPWWVEAKEITEVSNRLVNVIKQIEDAGVMVNLYSIISGAARSEGYLATIKIKDSSEKISLYKIAYPLINPSFSRRHGFRYVEILPFKNKKWVESYGRCIRSNERTNILQYNHFNADAVLTFKDICKLSVPEIADLIFKLAEIANKPC